MMQGIFNKSGIITLMDVRTGISLKGYTTMGIGGDARFMAQVSSAEDVVKVYQNAKGRDMPIFVLGGGSNVIARDEGFNGIIVLNRIMGFEILSDDGGTVTVRVGAGENWDDTVQRVVDMGLSGMEVLSDIPGTVGAAPVQNIGAYGQELSDILVSVDAYDSQEDRMVTLLAELCGLSYRHSIFRGEEIGRYCITSVILKLYRQVPQPPFYAALQNYLDEHHITMFTPKIIRDAVVAIRRDKLPNPKERPNSGSFFKNAIIEDWLYRELKQEYPDMPGYDMPDNMHKIPTGWLIEQTGLKGQVLHGMRVHEKNALVLINESAGSYENLAAARAEIIQQVYDKFRIQIEQEPLEMVLGLPSIR